MRADASGGKTTKNQPTLVDENKLLNARCLGLRRVLFWLSKFIYTKLFGSAQSLHSVSPFSRLHSSGLLHVTGSLANARLRPTKNLAPFHNFLQNCSTSFSSSQSGKANDESAARHIKLKQKIWRKKEGLNFVNLICKINPRWWMKTSCWTHEVRHIKKQVSVEKKGRIELR